MMPFPRGHLRSQIDRRLRWYTRTMFHAYLFVHGVLIVYEVVDALFNSTMPVVSIDYGFLGAPGELPQDAVGGQKMPVLVVRDRFTKAIFIHLDPFKGTGHFYPEAALVRSIQFLGCIKLILKSDQEPTILALASAVKNTFASQNIECQLENSPKGDSHGMSNGEADMSQLVKHKVFVALSKITWSATLANRSTQTLHFWVGSLNMSVFCTRCFLW